MISEVARVLSLSLMPLYTNKIVTVLGGLAKTATVLKDGKPLRFPIPYGAKSQSMQIEDDSFIPDSRQRAIIYFEGTNADITAYENNKSKFRAALKLVCWYNLEMFETVNSASVQISLLSEILGLLPGAKNISDEILGLTVIAGAVQDSTPKLFSQYSYKEERGQYLQPPYYSLGIDIVTTFQINHGCHGKLIPINVGGCC